MSEPGPLPVWLELSEAGAATSTPQRLPCSIRSIEFGVTKENR